MFNVTWVRSPFGAQVLRKDGNDPGWQPMEQQDMYLVDEGGATYLRVRVFHFTLFACGKKTDLTCAYACENHRNEMKVKFANATDAKVLLVWLPMKSKVESNTRQAVKFSVGAGGVEVGGGFEREFQTTYVMLPSRGPSSTLVNAQARTTWLGLLEEKCPERLIVCTFRDESTTILLTPSNSSASTDGTATPTHGWSTRNSEMTRVEFYDSLVVRGGESYTLLPKRLETGCQKAYLVQKNHAVLAHVAMALAGLVVPSEERRAPDSGWGWVTRLFPRGRS